MKRSEALNILSKAETLDEKFTAAYNILKQSPPISQDRMLTIYAYYKQAKYGDFKKMDENQVSNYIQTFKNNAWSQVNGLSSDKAKIKYIELTTKLIQNDFPE